MTRATLTFHAAANARWDAIVVGAGPAGALAARQLAQGGARVLLVEKKAFPRSKVCGACLNGRSLGVLHSVGLGTLVKDLGGIDQEMFHVGLEGRSARLALPVGMALSRAKLDAGLARAAIDAGADFLPETQASVDVLVNRGRRVRLTRQGETATVTARVVLVAAGIGNTCLERIGRIQTDPAPGSRIGAGCVVHEFPGFFQEKTIFMAVGRNGYVGLVSLGDSGLNVAAAFDKRFLRDCGAPGIAAASVLREAGFPAIDSLPDAAWQGTVSLTRQTRPLAEDRLFLLGDAAGYVEPFTGEGMGWALASGQAIAPLVLRGIERWEPTLPRAWMKLHRRLVGRRQHLCRSLAVILRHPWFARRAFELADRVPGLARVLLHHLNSPSLILKAS